MKHAARHYAKRYLVVLIFILFITGFSCKRGDEHELPIENGLRIPLQLENVVGEAGWTSSGGLAATTLEKFTRHGEPVVELADQIPKGGAENLWYMVSGQQLAQSFQGKKVKFGIDAWLEHRWVDTFVGATPTIALLDSDGSESLMMKGLTTRPKRFFVEHTLSPSAQWLLIRIRPDDLGQATDVFKIFFARPVLSIVQ